MMAAMMAGRGGMMGGGGAMGGGGRAAAQDGGSVYYVKAADDKGQYKVLPILMTVLIDQDHIQDLLVEMENSPMSIQVMDFELARPLTHVTKPEKGSTPFGGMGGGMSGMAGGMMSMMMRQGGMGRMAGFGGMAGSMQNQMMGQMAAMRGMMGGGGYPGMGAMGATTTKKAAVDKRNVDAKKEREKKEKAITES